MNIYSDYISNIRSAMNAGTKTSGLREGLSGFEKGQQPVAIFESIRSQTSEKKLLPSMQVFANELGVNVNFDQQLGSHPDFAHLKNTSKMENHYVTSMFIDIKGSTNLFKKYTPVTVMTITNTIQRAAIHTCLIFGGYIHRLQGDGLFVYHGRKGLALDAATLSCLQAASVFSYFVKNDLRNLFNEQGIEEISTRIGIDLGHDADVVWGMAGIGEISEITTCSLHTSLASKMQGSAASNGIVLGQNIFKELPALQKYFTPVSHRTKDEKDRYIFRIPEEGFNYTQYDFDWLTFLKQQSFIATDFNGNLTLKQKPVTRLSENIRPIAIQSKPYFR